MKASADAPGYYAILDGSQIIDFMQSGELWLTINDDAVSGNWWDNSGALDVSVTAIRSHAVNVPESPGVIPDAALALLVGVHGVRTLARRK